MSNVGEYLENLFTEPLASKTPYKLPALPTATALRDPEGTTGREVLEDHTSPAAVVEIVTSPPTDAVVLLRVPPLKSAWDVCVVEVEVELTLISPEPILVDASLDSYFVQ
ncbi:hypothetical protein K2P96_01705, partial [Patescibacteria group bacterium]|nr:hypothetical protein [Patescibacteria group bacterium]